MLCSVEFDAISCFHSFNSHICYKGNSKEKRVPVQHSVQSRWKIKHRRKGPSNPRNPSNAQLFKETVIVLIKKIL